MEDEISRRKLIEALEEVERRFPYKVAGKPDTYSEFNMAWESCMDCVFSAVDSQPPAERWIPCSERLPKDGEEVFVTYLKLNRNMKAVGKSKYSENPEPKKNHWSYHGNRVTAWMPAEPYKGVE